MGRSDINWGYITDNLDRAISEGWIQAYYMPIVRSSSGRVCEEEALARWIDPERGMLSPAEFIPVLEEAKLIYKLDLKIVDEVLKKMKAQAEAGLYVVPISVNLSRTDFDTCDIVEEICRRMDASGIARDKLIIEITENVIASDLEYMKGQIERFQSLGFHVWMDDFGSGYSSLDVLEEISFEHIKFDIRFMQHFDHEKSRIMLTELMKMAMSLGIRTITEGVETPEQAEFLRQIGCNKLQGYHFCKPVSLSEILERYEKGVQIGFENPDESQYYDSMGCINLYDLSVIAYGEDDENENDSLRRYFDTLPICIYESDSEKYTIRRCNTSFLRFVERYLDPIVIGQSFSFSDYSVCNPGSVYASAIKRVALTGGRVFFKESLPDNSQMRAVARRIAVNPVTGVSACVVVVLDIVEGAENSPLNYERIARALSSDYLYLFYVNLDNEHFIEYSHSVADDSLSTQRRGEDFFAASRRDAGVILHPDDQERFISAFTKENVLKSIDENGAFITDYRLKQDDGYVYVNMKSVRMGSNELIIGVNNVDAQIKLRKEQDRIQEERRAYSRVMALVGDFICIYAVDPDSCNYVEYSSTDKYDDLHMNKSGIDFFEDARDESMRLIYPEDVELFKIMFTREKMLEEINKSGQFTMIYRLMFDGTPEYVQLKASLMQEDDDRKIIVGVSFYR